MNCPFELPLKIEREGSCDFIMEDNGNAVATTYGIEYADYLIHCVNNYGKIIDELNNILLACYKNKDDKEIIHNVFSIARELLKQLGELDGGGL